MTHFPTTLVRLHAPEQASADYFLAAEEWLADHCADNCLFSWVVAPTVVCGRHQDATFEMDGAFCRAHNIYMVRRKSGGGCIYADEGNIMWSLIVSQRDSGAIFGEYAAAMTRALNQLGIAAIRTGRNDICLENGGKICGNAFYRKAHCCIVHGTMLFDCDMHNMLAAITPSRTKLASKSVKSVEKRIALLKNATNMEIGTLRAALEHALTNRTIEIQIPPEELATYRTWYIANRPKISSETQPTAAKPLHFEGVGTICCRLQTNSEGKITDVRLSGDYFENSDAQAAFRSVLIGLTPDEAQNAIGASRAHTAIAGLTNRMATEIIKNASIFCL